MKPLVRALTPEELQAGYEHHTGTAIVEHFTQHGINPVAVPGALLLHHAPFTWGKTPQKAVDNAIALEMCARMAILTQQLEPSVKSIPDHILDMHYLRKHGPGAYYGQK